MSIEETNENIDKYLCHIHRKPFTIYEDETIDLTHSSSTDPENRNMEIDEMNEYDINDNNIEYNTNNGSKVRNKPGQHLPRKGLRSACYFCRYIRIRVEGKAVKSECRTQIWCK
ncbi:15092_t:CDS:2, partial [Entrophospora sp. SA101]